MKIKTAKQAEKFLETVNSCKGQVWLESKLGTRLNLKSRLSQFVAVGTMASAYENDLELFCSDKNDERLFLNLFAEKVIEN